MLVYLDPEGVQALVKDNHLFSFHRDEHGDRCEAKKVAPLRRNLAGLDAWIAGQRQGLSVNRGRGPLREEDTVSVSAASQRGPGALIKFNPLPKWSSADLGGTSVSSTCLTTLCTTKDTYLLVESHYPQCGGLRAQAGRPLVVGRGDKERVRSTPAKHHRSGADLGRTRNQRYLIGNSRLLNNASRSAAVKHS